MNRLKETFLDPPAAYRTAPLWVWNDRMSERTIRGQLRKLKEGGFGGAFIHPRPGLITEYLSDEWFYYWDFALREAEALDMKLYIYDENSYPSGFAGGHVPARLPDCLAQGVAIRRIDDIRQLEAEYAASPLNRPGRPVKAYAYGADDADDTGSGSDSGSGLGGCRLLRDVTDLPVKEWKRHGERFVVCELNDPETNSWTGGFAYSDILRPEVAQAFLDSTYEAYRARFGDRFGEAIPAIFTDEPEICFGKLYQFDYDLLPFSYWFAGRFEQMNHYDIKDYLPYLFIDARHEALPHPFGKVRYDYYATLRQLWVDNFVRPISEWCERHGIAWTGHYVEHEWPYPWERAAPAVMSLYEYMQWPAIDMLGAKLLQTSGTDPTMLTIREAASVANQFRKPRVLCESFGAGGWDSSLEDYRRIGDWLMVHGINFINPHLTYASIVGGRKRDHPQSFDWLQPWWPEFRQLNDYFGRMSCVLSQGVAANRILVLQPTTGTFMRAPDAQAPKLYDPQGLERAPELRDYVHFLQLLCDRQWDYDLGDEFILERHARVERGKFVVREAAYDVVIVPAMMSHMKRSTLDALEAWMEAGGAVLRCGSDPQWMDGCRSDYPAELFGKFASDRCEDGPGVLRRLETIMAPRLVWEQAAAVPPGLNHLRRLLPDGSCFYYIVNSSGQTIDQAFAANGQYAEQWDGWTGEIKALSCAERDGKLRLPVRLAPRSAVLFRLYPHRPPEANGGADADCPFRGAATAQADATAPTAAPTLSAATAPVAVTLSTATTPTAAPTLSAVTAPVAAAVPTTRIASGAFATVREQPNVMIVDCCDLEVGTKRYRDVHTIHASHLVYQHHGYNMNPWDHSVQFKRRLTDRDDFGTSSGFAATFRFRVGPGYVPADLQVAVERAKYYRLVVNGKDASWSAGEWWLEEEIGIADIAAYVAEGENTVRLIASPFRADMELESLYLRGDFAVGELDGAWALGAPRSPAVGSWIGQGLPFYNDAVRYVKTFDLAAAEGTVYAAVKGWAGTAGTLTVNGRPAGWLREQDEQRIDITPFVRAGANELSVRICGSFKNLFGPHFAEEKPRKAAWPSYWKVAPKYGPQSPADYDLIDYGLLADVELEFAPASVSVSAVPPKNDSETGRQPWN